MKDQTISEVLKAHLEEYLEKKQHTMLSLSKLTHQDREVFTRIRRENHVPTWPVVHTIAHALKLSQERIDYLESLWLQYKRERTTEERPVVLRRAQEERDSGSLLQLSPAVQASMRAIQEGRSAPPPPRKPPQRERVEEEWWRNKR